MPISKKLIWIGIVLILLANSTLAEQRVNDYPVITLSNAHNLRPIAAIPLGDNIVISRWPTNIAFNANGQLLAIGRRGGDLFIYDLEREAFTSQTETREQQIGEMSFSFDGRLLFAVSARFPTSGAVSWGSLYAWNWEQGSDPQSMDYYEGFDVHIAVHPLQNLIASTADRGWINITQFDYVNNIAEYDWVTDYGGLVRDCTSLAFSADGELLVCGSHYGRTQILNWRQEEIVFETRSLISEIFDVALSLDGNMLVCSYKNGAIKVVDLRSGEVLDLVSQDPISDHPRFALSPTDPIVLVSRREAFPEGYHLDMNSDLELYNALAGGVITSLTSMFPIPIMDVAFSPLGNLIATAHINNYVILWAVVPS